MADIDTFLHSIARERRSDPLAPVTVIVPSHTAGLQLRRKLAERGAFAGVRFETLPRLAELLGAAHGLETLFTFGFTDAGAPVSLLFDDERQPAAKKLSSQMMSYWTQFAATGNPGSGQAGDLPLWGAWDSSSDRAAKYMVFDTEAGGGLRMSHER